MYSYLRYVFYKGSGHFYVFLSSHVYRTSLFCHVLDPVDLDQRCENSYCDKRLTLYTRNCKLRHS